MNAVAFTITPTGSAVLQRASLEPDKPKTKFDTAFLDRRMREHREMVARMEADLEFDIVREILAAAGRSR